MSAGGAKLQPIAALCAVLLFIWGGVAVASVVAQSEINHRLGLWPAAPDSWSAWSVLLSFAAAVLGIPALLCGVAGFRRRAALHVGALLVLLSVACTLAALIIDNTKFHVPWFGNDRSLWLNYRYGLTWHALPPALGFQRWWFFAEHLLLPLAVLVLLAWFLVLATGAGRRAPSPGLGYAYAAAPQADYRYVVEAGAPSAEEAAPQREVPPLTEPRDAPAPLAGATPEAEESELTEAAAVEPATEQAEAGPEDEIPDVESVRVAAQARPADDERVWFVTVQGTDHGPYSRTQLQSYADEGRLHAGTITHLAGGEDQALADVL